MLKPGHADLPRQPSSLVTGGYASAFKFTGTIRSVTVDVSAELIRDDEAELRVHMARQ